MVFKVKSINGMDEGEHYALKRFLLKTSHAVRTSVRELKILRRIANEMPNSKQLPTLYYSFIHSGSPIIVMKLLSKHTLLSLTSRFFQLTEYDVAFYAAEILHGLEQIHSMNIVHLDLRENNILFTQSGHLVISDFDRAIDLSSTPTFDNLDFPLQSTYSAPEIQEKIHISTKADIWSFGIVVREMLKASINPPSIHTDIVNKCLICAFYMRPDATQLKRHPMFRCFNWDCIDACSYPAPLLSTSLPYEFGDEMDQLKTYLKYSPSKEGTSASQGISVEVQKHQFLTECAFGNSLPCIIKLQPLYLSEDGTEIKGRAQYANSVLERQDLQEYMDYYRHYWFINPLVEARGTVTKEAHS
ncbi:unnamed protein product [Hymenolepis diminuta]|uniref:Protein kinase domain-containing protein n=1 Tax=Hymenolepis diminuta TaxID=6216 RepID=A0A0R3SAT0_HYMDI|nr:unnamed protein product [Hymenolepis diminuta]VUZ57830.1 unnamed protein product [Hymenolepis diminuta]